MLAQHDRHRQVADRVETLIITVALFAVMAMSVAPHLVADDATEAEAVTSLPGKEFDAAAIEFFEAKVRPLLVERSSEPAVAVVPVVVELGGLPYLHAAKVRTARIWITDALHDR